MSSRSPNLDVFLTDPGGTLGIESKLTEHLFRHSAVFSPKYREKIQDERRESAWFDEMLRLEEDPKRYAWLDAAQLVKHAYGLAYTFSADPLTLLYLYWEPRHAEQLPLFVEHRGEVEAFSERVAGSRPAFRAMSGLCTNCGKRPSADGGTTCEPCREARRAFERERYAARRAAGLRGYCGGPTLDGGSRCGPCAVRETERRSPEKKNAAARRLYARRRAAGLCTDCGEPSHGAARCEPCARRSYERSQYVRGLPLYPPGQGTPRRCPLHDDPVHSLS